MGQDQRVKVLPDGRVEFARGAGPIRESGLSEAIPTEPVARYGTWAQQAMGCSTLQSIGRRDPVDSKVAPYRGSCEQGASKRSQVHWRVRATTPSMISSPVQEPAPKTPPTGSTHEKSGILDGRLVVVWTSSVVHIRLPGNSSWHFWVEPKMPPRFPV